MGTGAIRKEIVVKFTKPYRHVNKVFLHCTAAVGDTPIATIEAWHVARWGVAGKRAIGYHYLINRDGSIKDESDGMRELERIPAAQKGHNVGSIAISMCGLNEFTQNQYVALQELCTAINTAYEGTVTFHGHCEVSTKACPVYDYKGILGLDLTGELSPHTFRTHRIDPIHVNYTNVSIGTRTIQLFDRGNDVKWVQETLATVPDGIFGKQTEDAVMSYQADNGLDHDGIVGDITWASLDNPYKV